MVARMAPRPSARRSELPSIVGAATALAPSNSTRPGSRAMRPGS
jgi:hypothetical protein